MSIGSQEHPLWSSFTLWTLHHNKQNTTSDNYSSSLQPIVTFNTIEQFYSVYNYMKKPSVVYNTSTQQQSQPSQQQQQQHNNDTIIYHIFRDSIQPLWEDQANSNGGSLRIRIKKHISQHNNNNINYIDRIYEDILLAIIGDTYNIGHSINGVILSSKNNEYVIQIWNNDSSDTQSIDKLKQMIKHVLNIPQHIINSVVEYKPHNIDKK